MKRIACCLWLIFLALPQWMYGQTDTTLLLEEVEVTARPIRVEVPGQRTESWNRDELREHNSTHIGELLSARSGIYLKNYGLGSSATTSIRGGSAGHTAVLWNGLPLQNPMLGQLDFSLLPALFTDEVTLQYGGHSAGWGSGAIGGVIRLDNDPKYIDGFTAKVQTETGSFGWWDQQASLDYGKKRLKGSSRFFHQQARNDFHYSVGPNSPERQQTHASFQQNGFLQQLYYRIDARNQLGIQAWWQENDREIPPLTTQRSSEAKQSDEFIRTALHWKYNGQAVFTQVRLGYFDDRQGYQDPASGVDFVNEFQSRTADAEGEWQIDEQRKLQMGFTYIHNTARSDSYDDWVDSDQIALFGAFRQEWKRWILQINWRQEWLGSKAAPIVPGLGIDGQISKWLLLRAKVSRNYRFPTLNDRFWNPGGNPDLKAESGWSEEIGLEATKSAGNHCFSWSATAFYRDIDNWILWSPEPGEFYFSPKNLSRVRSSGLEQRLNWSWEKDKLNMTFTAGYDLIRSTNEVAIEIPKIAAGEQLVYVPRHQAFGLLRVNWSAFSFRWQQSYTGSVNSQNDGQLPGYALSNAFLSWQLKRPDYHARLFLRIENVLNKNYRIIERRPMPGRHFRVGINFKLMTARN